MTIDLAALRDCAISGYGHMSVWVGSDDRVLHKADLIALLDRLEAAEKALEHVPYVAFNTKLWPHFHTTLQAWRTLKGTT